MPEQEREETKPLSPIEELLAKEQAEAIASNQQAVPESLTREAQNAASPDVEPSPLMETEQQRREREEQEQREWEAKRDSQGQDQAQSQEQAPGWLQAPQNEGILSHPTPDTSPASPGKEQHQQALADVAGERGGGMKRTISTKTTLGAVVTLDGVYAVPRYQSVIKETPMQDKVSYMRQLAKDQGSGKQQEQQQGQEQDKNRDREWER